MKLLDCSASIVVYNNQPSMLKRAINSILQCSLDVELHVIDNSQTSEIHTSLVNLPITYHFSGCNLGYGRGHNVAFSQCSASKYHLVLNPDIILAPTTINALASFMNDNPDIGMVCPKVVNPDGTLQHLNKRYPTLLDLFIRRFIPGFIATLFRKRLHRYEMRDKGYDSVCDIESMSGAFMFCRTDVLKKIGGFDPRYFMYFEDFDLTRKFQKFGYRTVYYPDASVIHLWERAAHKKLRMTCVFIINMIKYFNKWGWKIY